MSRKRFPAAGLVAGLGLALLAGCAPPLPPTASVAIQPLPRNEARLWFYRDYEPFESLNRPQIYLNGQPADVSIPGGVSYRDVPPGRYAVTTDTVGTDTNQFPVIDLRPGEERYLKVESLRAFYQSTRGSHRDTFYVRQMPPATARAEIAQRPFYGGS